MFYSEMGCGCRLALEATADLSTPVAAATCAQDDSPWEKAFFREQTFSLA
jgi:hypothetical protein